MTTAMPPPTPEPSGANEPLVKIRLPAIPLVIDGYTQYFDPKVSIAERITRTFDELGVSNEIREALLDLTGPLRTKHRPTWEHCIRAGLVAREIARFRNMDERALLFAGLLHDSGKAQAPIELLTKMSGWTAADREAMSQHVMDSYRLARGKFDFSAEILLWHHRFQPLAYPPIAPDSMSEYSEGTQKLIPIYGRVLAMADCYDAAHRVNHRYGGGNILTGEEIKEKMLECCPDEREMVFALYREGIFTTFLASAPAASRLPPSCKNP